jgi:hypothetical protein
VSQPVGAAAGLSTAAALVTAFPLLGDIRQVADIYCAANPATVDSWHRAPTSAD